MMAFRFSFMIGRILFYDPSAFPRQNVFSNNKKRRFSERLDSVVKVSCERESEAKKMITHETEIEFYLGA
jgi:hypothetical protein